MSFEVTADAYARFMGRYSERAQLLPEPPFQVAASASCVRARVQP